jgi:hypothetical protein
MLVARTAIRFHLLAPNWLLAARLICFNEAACAEAAIACLAAASPSARLPWHCEHASWWHLRKQRRQNQGCAPMASFARQTLQCSTPSLLFFAHRQHFTITCQLRHNSREFSLLR